MVTLGRSMADDSGASEAKKYLDEDRNIAVRVLLAIRGSLLLFTMAFGVLLALLGVVVEFTLANQGVLAAMLVIWGVSFVFFGILGFAALIAFGLR